MTPSKQSIAEWIRGEDLPVVMSEQALEAYHYFKHPLKHEMDIFTERDATLMLYVLMSKGYCPNLINNDNGKWQVSTVSAFNCQQVETSVGDVQPITIFCLPEDWHDTIAEAVLSAVKDAMEGGE